MSKIKIWVTLFMIVSLTVMVLAGCGPRQEQGPAAVEKAWTPSGTVEIVAPGSPGGGFDLLARSVQKTLDVDNIVPNDIIVMNKPGGGGAVGWGYLHEKRGQGEFLAVNSTLLIFNNLLGRSELTFRDFTPIANLLTEWLVVAVDIDSPYKTIKEYFEAMKKNPAAMPIGVGPALGNADHIHFLKLAKAHGIDPKTMRTVVYPGSLGELIPALLGGHVTAIPISLAEGMEYKRAGEVRILGISSDTRLEIAPDVPTWKEQGIDVVFAPWRGIMGPPDMTPEQIKFWSDAIARMVQQESWKATLKDLGLFPYYMPAEEYKAYLEKRTVAFESLLREVGLIN
ncbi:MAG: tripartite tricarboxylate transporter substrate binding protein [Syntrophomonadaceae bacterium]|nr:tripartite tricarboxylate transporter substrate binding protein [Syntrophomonadaceae bacterium]